MMTEERKHVAFPVAALLAVAAGLVLFAVTGEWRWLATIALVVAMLAVIDVGLVAPRNYYLAAGGFGFVAGLAAALWLWDWRWVVAALVWTFATAVVEGVQERVRGGQ